ncbi:B12-binding domain-containing radical SAM protein [Acidobacteriota bacterium]
MEKVLLINPAQTYYRNTHRESAQGSVGLPLGLLYIAAALEKKGCRVQVIDSLVSDSTSIHKHKDCIQYGIPSETLRNKIREFKPDIVGISSQYTTQEENVHETAGIVKDVDDSTLVMVGGANASCRSRDLLRSAKIDLVVKSEGEAIVGEIIEYKRGSKNLEDIDGIAYRDGEAIVETVCKRYMKNLDEIPLPSYHLIDLEDYITLYKRGIYSRDRDVKRNISMITSRGCPYKCVFCSIAQSMGKAWRPHSAEFVIHHIEELVKKYDIKHIHFEDDNLLFSHERFFKIIDVLEKENLTWDTPNGIRVDLALEEDMLRKLSCSGCKSLTIGVESGDEEILKRVVRKGITLGEVEEFARRCKKAGLPLRAFFILGFPGETEKTMKNTIAFAIHLLDKYDVEIINLIATPLFGTELFDICVKNKYFASEINPRTLSESTVSDGNCLIKTDSFTSEEVEHLSRLFTAKVFRRQFIKGLSRPIKSFKRVGNIYTLKRTVKRLTNFH